jgi:phage terminase small subunit
MNINTTSKKRQKKSVNNTGKSQTIGNPLSSPSHLPPAARTVYAPSAPPSHQKEKKEKKNTTNPELESPRLLSSEAAKNEQQSLHELESVGRCQSSILVPEIYP